MAALQIKLAGHSDVKIPAPQLVVPRILLVMSKTTGRSASSARQDLYQIQNMDASKVKHVHGSNILELDETHDP